MQIKVFKAGNMKDAMTAMKAELGEDAVILHSKKYKEGGILGIGSREVVEITAAVEETSLPKRTDTLRLNHPTVAPNSLLTRYKTDGTEQGVAEAEQRVEKLTQLDELAEKVSAQKAQASEPSKDFEAILQAETQEMQLEIRNEELGMEDDSVSAEEKSESIEETPSSEETIQSDEPTSQPEESIQSDESTSQPEESIQFDEPTSQPEESAQSDEQTSQPEESIQSEEPTSQSEETAQPDESTSQPEESIQPDESTSQPEESLQSEEPTSQPEESAQPAEPTPKPEEKVQHVEPSPLQMPIFTQEQMAQTQAMLMAQFNQMQMMQQAAIAQAQAQAQEQLRLQQAQAAEQFRLQQVQAQQAQQAATIAKPAPDPKSEEKIKRLEEEIAQMKALLAEVLGRDPKKGTVSLHEALKLQEVSEEVLAEIATQSTAGETLADIHSPSAKNTLVNYLNDHVKFTDGIKLNRHGVRIVALLGTTGVGKTTTLAKIAAKFVLEQRTNVALITADTYRISAVEQLKTYSDILELPLEIVYNPAELALAIERHRNKELILIDTAGRSQHNEYQMRELEEFLRINPRIEKHLVISSTTKLTDARQIMNKFSQVTPDRIIFTKTDETGSLGMIINLLRDNTYSLSYLTTGQSVPDDIERANADVLANLLIKKVYEQ